MAACCRARSRTCTPSTTSSSVATRWAARILLSAFIDGSLVADYRADGVIVATATGSTAYSQAIGGPILHPEAKEMVLVPLAPHLGQANSLVLPATSVVDLALEPDAYARP